MANTVPAMVSGTRTHKVTIDTTADFNIGNTASNSIGSVVIQTTGTGWTGTVTPKGRLLGDSAWVSLAYYNFATAADVAAGTNITGDGLFSIRADHGMEIQLSTTTSAGSVIVTWHWGIG